jgi:hypothetical protein
MRFGALAAGFLTDFYKVQSLCSGYRIPAKFKLNESGG